MPRQFFAFFMRVTRFGTELIPMSDEIPDFKLTAAEVHSATWQRLKAHFEHRLDEHRRANDGNLSFDATTKLRGRVAEILYLLAVGEPDLPAPMADHDE